MTTSLIGSDGCRAGWICVQSQGEHVDAWISSTFEEVLARASPSAFIGVDIPIGLPESGSRTCDREARQILGRPRGSSVFSAPVRRVLMVDDYARACEVHRSVDGRAITKQCFNLLPKIRELDALLRGDPECRRRVFEIHPEISFALWHHGVPMQANKKTQAGQQERLALIETKWPGVVSKLRSQLPKAGYGVDDLHDAIAALWSIGRHHRGESKPIPDMDQRDAYGLQMRIIG